jgi:hypothetical protein
MTDHLVHAIIAIDPERLHRLYVESADFHQAVDLIARVMRPLVGIIADEAADAENRRDAMLQTFRDNPPDFEAIGRMVAEENSRTKPL